MATPVSQRLTEPGFWFERIRYTAPVDGTVLTAAYYATTHPEMIRAFEWIDGDGVIGAGAALRRGEPCELSISAHDTRIVWTVRPVTFVALASSDPFDACPRKKGQGVAGYLKLLPLAP